jgi:hypothetical protein
MKRLSVILFALFAGFLQAVAQDSGKLDSFRDNVLPGNAIYFDNADLMPLGQLSLSALDAWTALPTGEKRVVMERIFKAVQDSIIIVHYGSKRELWGRSAETHNVLLLDRYDLNAPLLGKVTGAPARLHPWFFFIGLQLGTDSQHDINFALNLRGGAFLLKNRWDFAGTFSVGSFGNATAAGSVSSSTSVGLMSRFHFPIRKLKMSPNVGAEVALGVSGSSAIATSVTGSLVLGVSWFVGIGNIDMSIHIGKPWSVIAGYTIMPGVKPVK